MTVFPHAPTIVIGAVVFYVLSLCVAAWFGAHNDT